MEPLPAGKALSSLGAEIDASPCSEVAFLEESATLASERPVTKAKVYIRITVALKMRSC